MTAQDDFYLRAFFTLGTSRINGMSVGAIPWHQVLDYGLKVGLDSEMISPFVQIVLKMDEFYIELINKKSEKK